MINSVLNIHFIEFPENIIESLNYKKRGMEPRSDKNRYHRILFPPPHLALLPEPPHRMYISGEEYPCPRKEFS